MSTTCWDGLREDRILNAVEKTLGHPLNNLCLPRNSYINRVFEVEQDDKQARFIIKFFRPNRWNTAMLQEELDLVQYLYDKELPVIPALTIGKQNLFQLDQFSYAIFPKKGGRSIDELNQDLWEQIGRLLGKLHAMTQTYTVTNRLTWTPKEASTHHHDIITRENCVPELYKDTLDRSITQFIEKTTPLFQNTALFLIHGDCHLSNIIYRPNEGLYMIDFNDIVIGPAIQDVWMLFPGDPRDYEREFQWFCDGYNTFSDFPYATLSLIPALQGMRLIHFMSWCALQHKEPHFKHHFPEWGTPSYWNESIKQLQGNL